MIIVMGTSPHIPEYIKQRVGICSYVMYCEIIDFLFLSVWTMHHLLGGLHAALISAFLPTFSSFQNKAICVCVGVCVCVHVKLHQFLILLLLMHCSL